MAITTGGCSGMAWPNAGPLGADPQAAAELPADDAGADEYLYPAPQHPRFVRLWAGRTAAANPPADGPAVDGAGPATAADVPAAGPTAAAVLPADGSGDDEHLHADVQHPPLLPARRDAVSPRGYARDPTGEVSEEMRKTPSGEAQGSLPSSTRSRITREYAQGRGLTAPALFMPRNLPFSEKPT